ncbi:toll/interleukin-1 receptor domain-containing protein [Mycolicibacterium sp. 624]|uniref:toll/interleukin-1 receptor domain-containing protein n=1 Tax=Mycolicibacterium sp. 624 TaxID=3156314 RepID=UPI003397AC4A
MTMTDEATGEPPEGNATDVPTQYKYDIAVSFAGEQRDFVHDVVRGLGLPKDRVFYDADYKAALWGEELTEVFTTLYRDEARYVVMFISREYAEKEWCGVERKAALRRRMMTQGAYILPVRLDSTKLDDVKGLLGTIGDLDGVREGVAGVIEAIREKLDAVMTEQTDPADPADDEPRFGEVQATQEGLVALLQERPHSWRWAAFASVLVQRREAMSMAMRDHRLGFAHPTGDRITTFDDLADLARNTVHDVEQVGQQMNGFLLTDAFQSVFGTPEDESDADPDGIVHVATRLMDFYDRYLQLAQRVRGVAAPSDFINVLDTCARLVDLPLSGMEDFIEEYLVLVETMPARLIAAEGQHIVHPIGIQIHMDNELLEELIRQLKDLADRDDEGD